MKKKVKASNVILFIVCVLVAAIMLIPFIWMLSASFQQNTEIFRKPFQWIPEIFRFENYERVWTQVDFLKYYLNTIKVTVLSVTIQVITCSLAAFAFTKLKFPGRDKIFFAYIATMMVPWNAIMIPQFIIIKNMGLYNTHAALILIGSFNAFGVFLLRQNMLSIPSEMNEAAKIDGCGVMRTYWNIIMPLSKGSIATLIILQFNQVWNDYMAPMIYLDSDSKKTIQLGLASFKQQYSADYGAIMAGTVCAVIPIIIVYAFAQKYIIEGMAHTGVKG
ncbi:carbohydrate ABC transporter permease [Enterocloster clostridioformis]|uniref:carbohydrate ABC transporter permease n=1 Tax=Enterocloster clostridioformis TaxID=1531 RepID=UPI0026773996|nr:carbohydrate ABC transporter permease [Enterocloster clostridioformis]